MIFVLHTLTLTNLVLAQSTRLIHIGFLLERSGRRTFRTVRSVGNWKFDAADLDM